ncbi:hypothetical protein Tco_0804304 [Tanacetum coccineum]|uniref:Uncharacterized protein n=1 Tax=Tanacetum coccineum TaxID=301880 RepID=A0ABQ5A6S6_9ASTR
MWNVTRIRYGESWKARMQGGSVKEGLYGDFVAVAHFRQQRGDVAHLVSKDSKEVSSIWKAFGGNTHDLGSFREETDKIMNQHQDSSRFKVLEPGSGVTTYTRRRHTSSSDGVTTSLDGVSPHRLNSDLEDSTL